MLFNVIKILIAFDDMLLCLIVFCFILLYLIVFRMDYVYLLASDSRQLRNGPECEPEHNHIYEWGFPLFYYTFWDAPRNMRGIPWSIPNCIVKQKTTPA